MQCYVYLLYIVARRVDEAGESKEEQIAGCCAQSRGRQDK